MHWRFASTITYTMDELGKRESSLEALSQVFRQVLGELPTIIYRGKVIEPRMAASPLGLLPAWLAEADRIWLDITGISIGLHLLDRPAAPLKATVAFPPRLAPSAVLACMTYSALSLERGRGIVIDPLVEMTA